MLSQVIRWVVLTVVRLFYGRVEVRGMEHVPASGPIIFILNHPNGLIDALLPLAVLHRRVALLGKSTFFEHPFWRWFMPAFDVLPVFRQRDKGQAGGPNGNLLDGNAATFARCEALLQGGGALALFPEGTTHSNSSLLPLKSGAARLALDAEAAGDWQRGIQIVPVGLWYAHKTRLGSAARVVFGQPWTLESHADLYNDNRRKAVRALTQQMAHGLHLVVQQAATTSQHHETSAAAPSSNHRPWSPVGWSVQFLLLLPWALVGWVLSYALYRLVDAATPFVVRHDDTITSTGKLIGTVFLVPLGWLVAAVAVGVLAHPLWGIVVLGVAPLGGYAALWWRAGVAWREKVPVVARNFFPSIMLQRLVRWIHAVAAISRAAQRAATAQGGIHEHWTHDRSGRRAGRVRDDTLERV